MEATRHDVPTRMSHEDPKWVNHCLSLIIGRKERELAEEREDLLRAAMALFPEIDPE